MSPFAHRLLTRLFACGSGAAATLAAGTARADGGYVAAGPLGGGTLSTAKGASAWAYGGELSHAHYRARCCWDGGWGLFAQYLRYTGDGGSNRLAVGYQYPGPVGFEAGVGVRFGDRGTTPSLHLAPFASMGLAHVALRLSPGVGDYGSEAALVVGIKLPLPYGSPPPPLGVPHGRPLEIAGAARRAGIDRRTDWA